MVQYDFGELIVKSRALRICALLNWAVSTMEPDQLLTIVEGLSPSAIGKLINEIFKSREVHVPDSASDAARAASGAP
jgi:hypothetical protein